MNPGDSGRAEPPTHSFEKAVAQTDCGLLTPAPVNVSGGRERGVPTGKRDVVHMCLARWSGISMRPSKSTCSTGPSMWQALRER